MLLALVIFLSIVLIITQPYLVALILFIAGVVSLFDNVVNALRNNFK